MQIYIPWVNNSSFTHVTAEAFLIAGGIVFVEPLLKWLWVMSGTITNGLRRN